MTNVDSLAEDSAGGSAHVVPDKVVRAYKRTTFVEMRRTLLEAWSEFTSPSSPPQSTESENK
jgi:hypothetical protein